MGLDCFRLLRMRPPEELIHLMQLVAHVTYDGGHGLLQKVGVYHVYSVAPPHLVQVRLSAQSEPKPHLPGPAVPGCSSLLLCVSQCAAWPGAGELAEAAQRRVDSPH
jgi:hypothetical protein